MPRLVQTSPVHEPSDDALMQAYALGEEAAFERLYTRHQAGLYRFVRRLLGTALTAQTDEVFQDTWMRVVQSRHRWVPQRPSGAESTPEGRDAADPDDPAPAGNASFRTWLFTVAHHRVVDLWRRSGREVVLDFGEEDAWEPAAGQGTAWQHWPAPASGTPATDDLAFWRKAGVRLLACLDELPLPQRSTFLLHHDDGLPLEEVARAVGVGFETAKTRLRYAMSKLRRCMGAYLTPHEGGWA